MAARSNAISELTRFWLEARHNCLTGESLPVKVRGGNSDIDIAAIRPDGSCFALPTGGSVGPHLIVETKDEHDFDSKGREFGKQLRADMAMMGEGRAIHASQGKPRFTMLREEHFDRACQIFGSDDFDRLFVVHAIDPQTQIDLNSVLAARRIHWLGIREVVKDLREWYCTHQGRSGLRHTLVGDMIHLLWGYCED